MLDFTDCSLEWQYYKTTEAALHTCSWKNGALEINKILDWQKIIQISVGLKITDERLYIYRFNFQCDDASCIIICNQTIIYNQT